MNTAAKGYLSIIQYCPDLARREAANIGVVLFCPDQQRIKAKVSTSNDRPRQFFGTKEQDWSQIKSFKLGIAERVEVESENIRTREDFEHFIATRGNMLQLTPAIPVKVRDFEEDLQRHFDELVGQTIAKKKNRLEHQLDAKFKSAGVEDRLQRNLSVPIPVFDQPIRFPFAYQNAGLHYIKPVDFEGRDRDAWHSTACHQYAIGGEYLYRSSSSDQKERRLIIVAKFDPGQSKTRDVVTQVLDDHKVKCVPFDQLGELIDEIREHAHRR